MQEQIGDAAFSKNSSSEIRKTGTLEGLKLGERENDDIELRLLFITTIELQRSKEIPCDFWRTLASQRLNVEVILFLLPHSH